MRIAIIDLGTNTFKILIFEKQENQAARTIYKTKIPVNLAEGMNNNRLTISAFIRGLNALRTFKDNIIGYYQVEKTLAMATSGIRSTENGMEFVEYVERELDIKISIISGNKEAELIYTGVKAAVPMDSEDVLLLDIGGGSAEFIIGNAEKIKWMHSFKLGASRLTEKFRPADPITDAEIKTIEAYFEEKLQPLFEVITRLPVRKLIGSSGSFNSLGRMAADVFSTPETYRAKPYYLISPQQFEVLYKKLIESSLEERKGMEGIKLIRIEIIVMAVLLINYVMKSLPIESIIQSQYSLVEGAISDLGI